MGKYNGAVITAAGQNLIAQAIAESKIVTFTTAQASSHVYPSSTDFEALTALTDVEKTVDINYAGVYSNTVVQVSARFDNNGVETAYLINTLGFFAQLGTDAPILFAISTAVTPDQMPVFDADNPSAFIYNMQITVQNADSVTVTVNPAGTVTIEQLDIITNDIYGKIGNLTDLATDDKTSLVDAVNEVDSHADSATTKANTNATHIGTLSSLTTTAKNNLVAAINEVDSHADATQQMIAPIQTTLTASKAYAKGEQFAYNGLLYKATATIAQGGTITIGGNCALADSVTEQIRKTPKFSFVTKLSASFSAETNGTVSFDLPSGATEIKAVIPLGSNPSISWNTIAVFSGLPVLSSLTVPFRTVVVYGAGATQQYTIHAVIVYV